MTEDETDILLKLESQPEERIPLLEDSGLFTEEELEVARRKDRTRRTMKIFLIVAGLLTILFGALKGIRLISFVKESPPEYEVESFSIDRVLDDGLEFSFAGLVKAPIPWSVWLKKADVQIMNEEGNEAIASMFIDELHVFSGKFSKINFKGQRFNIQNSKELAKLLNSTSRKMRLPLNLKVITGIRPHWIPYTFTRIIKRSILLDLKSAAPGKPLQLDIKDIQLEETADDHVLATLQIAFKNPLPIAIQSVPKLSLRLHTKDQVYLGRVQSVQEFSLKSHPESTQASIRAILSPQSSPENQNAISNLIANYLAGKPNKLRLRGDPEASSKLKWLQALINGLDLQITVPGKMFEEAIKKIDVKSLNFILTPEKPESIALQSHAQISYSMPRVASALRPQVERIAMQGSIHDQQGHFLAPLDVPEHAVQADPKQRNTFSTSLALEIPISNEGAGHIDLLLQEMLWAETTEIGIRGTSSLKTKLTLGSISLPKIAFATSISLPGLGGVLSRSRPIISNLQFEEIKAGSLSLQAKVELDNPTTITSQLGTIHFTSFVQNGQVEVGEAWLPDALIKPGINSLDGRLRIALNEATLTAIMSNPTQELVLKGVSDSPDVHPVLKNVMGSMMLRSHVQSLNVLNEILISRGRFEVFPKVYTTVSNPLPIEIKILKVWDLKVYAWNDEVELSMISEMDKVPLEEPQVIPASVDHWTDTEHPLPVSFDGNLSHALNALRLLAKKDNPHLRLEGRVQIQIESYLLEFGFIKDRVPVRLSL